MVMLGLSSRLVSQPHIDKVVDGFELWTYSCKMSLAQSIKRQLGHRLVGEEKHGRREWLQTADPD
jgi:hypothetical protein